MKDSLTISKLFRFALIGALAGASIGTVTGRPICSTACPAALSNVLAQSPITTMALGPNQIATIKCAQGITTRVTFPEVVKEIICGDLYDGSANGSFVAQRSGNDVFLKSIVSKGASNMFVKTGEKGEHVYNFDLQIVPASVAYRVVNVTYKNEPPEPSSDGDRTAAPSGGSSAAAEEAIRAARKEADRLIAQAEQEAAAINRDALDRSAQADRTIPEKSDEEISRRFAAAVLAGLPESKAGAVHASVDHVLVAVDKRVLKFGNKYYVHFTIQNNSGEDFAYSEISLESGFGPQATSLQVSVVQARNENKVSRGESQTGVVVFEWALPHAGLSFVLKAAGNSEVARLIFQ